MGEQQKQTVIGAGIFCVVGIVVAFVVGVLTGSGERMIDKPKPIPFELRNRDREYSLMTEIHTDLHAMRDDLRAIRSSMPRRGDRIGEEVEKK